jgi:hypothetical protein
MTYDIVGQHAILVKPTMYDLRHRDIQEYRRYDVAYDIVGVTYDVLATDLRYHR